MRKTLSFVFLIVGLALAVSLNCRSSGAQDISRTSYDIGTPTLSPIWVDPKGGNDDQNGTSRARALRTLNAAWDRIPRGRPLSATGYEINLVAGTYSSDDFPIYWESRYGTHQFPIILRSVDGDGAAVLRGYVNVFDTRYLYLIGVTIAPRPGGEAFHCELCDHLLIKHSVLKGGDNQEAQETAKLNQCREVYIEDSDISGAWNPALDFMAVQYGHVVRNRIHDSGDWCFYAKGGSAYFLVEGNTFDDCNTGGFSAGQGSGFEFMVSPWLHYDAYDIKFINNVIHDTDGAGFGVNGGYNILLAFNTLYRVGSISHGIEVVYGLRGCDGNVATCAANLNAGGWGLLDTENQEPIPDRNIYIYNNVLYNPPGFRSQWSQFAIFGPADASAGTNIPSPVMTDTNLRIAGNVIWNGPGEISLGAGEDGTGCQASNPTCNVTQLMTDNAINITEPALRDPDNGDFRPVAEGNLFTVPVFPIPDFAGGDQPSPPLAPVGNLSNAIARDYTGAARASVSPPGAYASADAVIDDPGTPADDTVPQILSVRCSPRRIALRGRVTCTVRASDDHGIAMVAITIGDLPARTLRLAGGSYSGSIKIPKTATLGRVPVVVTVRDTGGQETIGSGGQVRIQRRVR